AGWSCSKSDKSGVEHAPTAPTTTEATAAASRESATPFDRKTVARLDEPWAMTFLPDRRLLITEKKGALRLLTTEGKSGAITGVPEVAYGGQGGLGDVILHPNFDDNGVLYLSWAEAGEGGERGAAV